MKRNKESFYSKLSAAKYKDLNHPEATPEKPMTDSGRKVSPPKNG